MDTKVPRARNKLYVGFTNTFSLVLTEVPWQTGEQRRLHLETRLLDIPLSEHRPTHGGKRTLLACEVSQSPLTVDWHKLHHDPGS